MSGVALDIIRVSFSKAGGGSDPIYTMPYAGIVYVEGGADWDDNPIVVTANTTARGSDVDTVTICESGALPANITHYFQILRKNEVISLSSSSSTNGFITVIRVPEYNEI